MTHRHFEFFVKVVRLLVFLSFFPFSGFLLLFCMLSMARSCVHLAKLCAVLNTACLQHLMGSHHCVSTCCTTALVLFDVPYVVLVESVGTLCTCPLVPCWLGLKYVARHEPIRSHERLGNSRSTKCLVLIFEG